MTNTPSRGQKRYKNLKITGTVPNEWSYESEEVPGVLHLGM